MTFPHGSVFARKLDTQNTGCMEQSFERRRRSATGEKRCCSTEKPSSWTPGRPPTLRERCSLRVTPRDRYDHDSEHVLSS